MKQSSKSETEMLNLISKLELQLNALDKKVDILLQRSLPQAKPPQKPPVNNERMMYKAICADCQKECTIPFKPSGDRPVYCQDCFSRRKVINLSGMTNVKSQGVVSLQKPVKETPKAKKKAPKKK